MSEDALSTAEIYVSITPETKFQFKQLIEVSGADVIEPEKYNIPEKYDLSDIKADNQQNVSRAISRLEEYLSCPIISDKFDSHEKRRDWRIETYKSIETSEGTYKAEQFDNFLKMNKMKRNRISVVFAYTDALAEYTKIPEDLTNGLIGAIAETLPENGVDPMDGPTTPDKIARVEKISDQIVKVLNYFGDKDKIKDAL